MAVYQTSLPSNFPTKPTPINVNSKSFPNDLVKADGSRSFYTMINMVDYSTLSSTSSLLSGTNVLFNSSATGAAASPSPIGAYILPIPKALDDNQVMSWEQTSPEGLAATAGQQALKSLNSAFVSAAVNLFTAGAGVASAGSGVVVNPMLWMMFKSPGFKTFTLEWTLTPNNEQESQTIADMIHDFKKYSLPSMGLGNAFFNYPQIAMIKLYPNDLFTFKFKPCAITNVAVNYNGAGVPSFFNNGAPTVVTLSISLKEIELWTQDNYDL